MKVLFICTGNTCRSCMAEALAKNLLENSALEVEFSSAGIYAVKGQVASINATKIMKEMGVDLSQHITTPVTEELLMEANLILTLTKAHKNLIISNYPNTIEKTFSLQEYVGEAGDISDPFGGDLDNYRNCANTIKTSIEKLIFILKES